MQGEIIKKNILNVHTTYSASTKSPLQTPQDFHGTPFS